LLLKGYTNKRISIEAESPLSTIQRRIRKIVGNEYVHRKTESNHKKIGLRKGYLLISLKGDHSKLVAGYIKNNRNYLCIVGSIDILCACLFRETSDLFKITETIKTIENVDKVSWAEELLPSKEITVFRFHESINSSGHRQYK